MSKKIKLFCGPLNYDIEPLYFQEANEFIVGVDAGLTLLLEKGMTIDLAVGDFDSIDEETLAQVRSISKETIQLPVKKNQTDLAFALEYLYQNMDYQSITVYGGIGGRIDHFLANINLIKQYDLEFIDNHHRLYPLKKGQYQVYNQHTYISFFAIEDVYDLTIKGFEYELDNYYLSKNDSLCVSNRGSGEIAFSKGRLLVVMTDDIYDKHLSRKNHNHEVK